ncbi:hypothetical protein HDU93_008044, partial [Gonapodya sp. JEL0774]
MPPKQAQSTPKNTSNKGKEWTDSWTGDSAPSTAPGSGGPLRNGASSRTRSNPLSRPFLATTSTGPPAPLDILGLSVQNVGRVAEHTILARKLTQPQRFIIRHTHLPDDQPPGPQAVSVQPQAPQPYVASPAPPIHLPTVPPVQDSRDTGEWLQQSLMEPAMRCFETAVGSGTEGQDPSGYAGNGNPNNWTGSLASASSGGLSLGNMGAGASLDACGVGFGLANTGGIFSQSGMQSVQSQGMGVAGGYADPQSQPEPAFVRHVHVHQRQLPLALEVVFAVVSPQAIAAGLAALAQQHLVHQIAGNSGELDAVGAQGAGVQQDHRPRAEYPPTVSFSLKAPRGGFEAWELYYHSGTWVKALNDWTVAEVNAKTADEIETGAGKKSALGQRYRKVKRIALIYNHFQAAGSAPEFERLYGNLANNFRQLYAAITKDSPDKMTNSQSQISNTHQQLRSASPQAPELRRRAPPRSVGASRRRNQQATRGGIQHQEGGDELDVQGTVEGSWSGARRAWCGNDTGVCKGEEDWDGEQDEYETADKLSCAGQSHLPISHIIAPALLARSQCSLVFSYKITSTFALPQSPFMTVKRLRLESDGPSRTVVLLNNRVPATFESLRYLVCSILSKDDPSAAFTFIGPKGGIFADSDVADLFDADKNVTVFCRRVERQLDVARKWPDGRFLQALQDHQSNLPTPVPSRPQPFSPPTTVPSASSQPNEALLTLLTDKDRESRELRAELDQVKERNEELSVRTAKAESKAEELRRSNLDIEARNTTLDSTNQDLQSENRTLSTENRTLSAENLTLSTENRTLSTKNTTLEREVGMLHTKLASLLPAPPPREPQPPRTVKKLIHAIADYNTQDVDELDIAVDDEIYVNLEFSDGWGS